jgi:hypothetical protein
MPFEVVDHLGASETRTVFPPTMLTATVAEILAAREAPRRG